MVACDRRDEQSYAGWEKKEELDNQAHGPSDTK
jgi:hypothetical protein